MKIDALRVRLISFNTWHALDASRPYLMLPSQGIVRLYRRYEAQVAAIRKLINQKDVQADIICLQELNPLSSRVKQICKQLELKGSGTEANTGVRIGRIGYPFFLNEGIGSFYRGALHRIRYESTVISGAALSLKNFLGLPVFFQVAEKRVAMKMHAEIEGVQICILNLHMHNGAESPEAVKRRSEELMNVVNWLEKDLKKNDLIFVCGDFNCPSSSKVLEPLRTLGFRENPSEIVTWDAANNPLCQASVERAENEVEETWELTPKQLDHIFYRCSDEFEKEHEIGVRYQRVLDEGLSDHFGLMMDLSVKKKIQG